MDNKILRRAKALLAMSQDSSSENEAMIAARKLHALLAKHNIAVGELEDRPEEVGRDGFESIDWPWRRTVLLGIAELYFCKCYYSQTRKNYADYFLIGTETNRLFAQTILKNVFTTIEQVARDEGKAVEPCRRSTFITSFHNGAAQRIYDRCQELIKAAKAGELDDGDGTNLPAMVGVYDLTAKNNQVWLDENLGKMEKKSNRTKAFDSEGFAKGKEAGSRVQLSRSLQNKNAAKQLTHS